MFCKIIEGKRRLLNYADLTKWTNSIFDQNRYLISKTSVFLDNGQQ